MLLLNSLFCTLCLFLFYFYLLSSSLYLSIFYTSISLYFQYMTSETSRLYLNYYLYFNIFRIMFNYIFLSMQSERCIELLGAHKPVREFDVTRDEGYSSIRSLSQLKLTRRQDLTIRRRRERDLQDCNINRALDLA